MKLQSSLKQKPNDFFAYPINQESLNSNHERSNESHGFQKLGLTFEKALDLLISAIGEENVKFDGDERLSYARSSLSKGTLPSAIVKPGCRQEVETIVKIASDYRLSVHPISTGKNWGYSDANAVSDGQIILDLGRMNKILEVNEKLGYITLEPGVTQGQVYDYLQKNNINLWMDATGAGPDTSIIGNTMERGFGHSPYGDRYAHSCGYEVVLPNGEVLNTGFGHYSNSKVTEVYKWGVGPSIDGLFTQSNLGIVTKMTLWLMPKPEAFKVVIFMLKNEGDIAEFIERVRVLRMDGTLKSVIHIGNDLRIVSMSQSYPFAEMENVTALSMEKRKELAKKNGVGFWSGTAGLYGSKEQIKADLAKIKKALRGFKGLKAMAVIDEKRLAILQKTVGLLNRFGFCKELMSLGKKVSIAMDLLKGKSPETCVQGSLWRIRDKKPENKSTNPLDYHAGFYWISPMLPMEGHHVIKLISLVEPIFHRYGFDLQQTLSMTTERALTSVMTISFDKKNEVESQKAKICHDEVVKALLEEGYILYRSGNHTMSLLPEKSNVYFDFLKKIKGAVDPHQVISPGKYIPVV
jgi:4-cresol dehydrogenase (hydroxylating)